jgi:diacylglycerol kinase (ATP)
MQEERAFLLLAGAGFTSAVIDRSLGLKRWLGGPAYFVAALRELLHAKARPARLTLDGAAEQVAVVEMMILNAPWVGGGMLAGPGADAQDGWLEALIVQEMSRWHLLNVVLRVYRGSHLDQPGVRYGTTKRVAIEPEVTMPVSVDGEVVGQTPAEFWVAPSALTVVAGEVRAG